MPDSAAHKVQRFVRSTEFWSMVLLLAVVLTIFLAPVFPVSVQSHMIRIFFTVMYFAAVFSLEKRLKSLVYLSLVTLFMEWISGVYNLPVLSMVSRGFNVIFFLYVVTLLIMQIARAARVTAKVILSSITGYLLIGIIFSLFVYFIMQADPAAYYSANSQPESMKPMYYVDSIYYSFVTLATLGYGDIVPVKPYTRSLSVLICVSGQFYIAILMALLVGKFASGRDIPEK